MKNYDVGHVPLRLPRAKQLLGVIDRYVQQSASLPPKYPNTTQIPPKHTWRARVFRTLDDPGSGTLARWVNVAVTATGEFFLFPYGQLV